MKFQLGSKTAAVLLSATASAFFISASPALAQSMENGIGVIAPVPFQMSGQVYRPGDAVPLQVSTVLNDVFDAAGNGVMVPVVVVAQIWATENIMLGNFRPSELTVGRAWTVPDNRFPNETMIYTLSFSGPAVTYNCPTPISKDTCGTADGTVGNVDIAISGERLTPVTTKASTTIAKTTSSAAAQTTKTVAPVQTTVAPVATTTTSVQNAVPNSGFKAAPSIVALAVLLLALLFF